MITTDNPAQRTVDPTGLRDFAEPAAGAGMSPRALAASQKTIDPAEILGILRKRRRLVIIAAIIGPLLGLGVSMLMTPKYQATTQISVQPEDPQFIPGSGDARPLMLEGQTMMGTLAGLLRSESLAARVVEAKRLANDPEYAEQSASAAERRNQATVKVHKQVTIEPVRDSRLIDIRVVTPDPAKSAAIANAYADQFIASNIDRDFGATANARKFLEDRIATTRDKLEKSEREVVAYATRNGIIDVGTGGENGKSQTLEAASLAAVNTALTEAMNQRIAAEQKYRQAQLRGMNPDALNNPVLQELQRQRSAAQAEYQEKSAIFLPGLPALEALKRRIASLDRDIARERTNGSTATRAEYEAAVARENQLRARLNENKGNVLDLRKRSIEYTILQREVDTNRALYDALLQKYKEVGVASGIGTNKVSIVDTAKVPTAPTSPNLPLNVLIGLIGGLLAGMGLAFAIEFLDDAIKQPGDVSSKLHMTLLGVIPKLSDDTLVMDELRDPKSDIVEAAHSLRTSLQFATSHGMPKSLLVTSSRPGEGKSSISLAVASSLARLGKTVLLVDADMRKPTFYVEGESRKSVVGLSNLLAGEASLTEVLRATDIAQMDCVPAGPIVPNPAALLSDGGFAQLMRDASEKYEHVIVDGPPVMALADAPLIGSMVEATVLVVEASGLHRSSILNAVGRLVSSRANLLGVVLNKFASTRDTYGYGYSYAYSYSYGGDDADGEHEDRRKITILK